MNARPTTSGGGRGKWCPGAHAVMPVAFCAAAPYVMMPRHLELRALAYACYEDARRGEEQNNLRKQQGSRKSEGELRAYKL